MNHTKNISPWAWVPTLYFAQGIPYFIVNNISVMMFTKMGVPNGEMALFTSLLYLPWTIKPFWSPFVDIIKTKRWWTLSMQILMSVAFILLTLSIPRPDEATMAAGTTPISMFSITLMLFIITAFASATHDIAADGFYMLALKQSDQAAFVGIRSTFYRLASIFGQGVLVAIAGAIELRTENIPLSWTITMLVTAVLFSLVTFYHLFAVPKPTSDKSTLAADAATAGAIFREFGRTFATYFTKPGALLAIVFMLLYRLPEAFLIKMCMPFLVASKESGGLELSTAEVGIVYGTIGVIFLTLGGILGGLFASRIGLKKSIWWMAGCMTLPCLTFVYLAIAQPDNLFAISTAIAIEQFGYGFGFTAYMLYMMYFSEGEFKTSHYAICTAFMALSMMIPVMKRTIIISLLCLLCGGAMQAQKIRIKTGIEVLKEQNFRCLEGKRVGLITNPTGVDNRMRSTIDILHEAPNVNLVALYGPEHGVRGDVHAGDHVTDIKDATTGLPVYSLYGKTRKATPDMLKDVDVLVYDIQDIGCRSFTYISTMGLAMEAAAENGKEFIVLDRPNPVGGLKIEGNLVEDDCISFVSQFKIPYLYALTCGELALMLNGEKMLKDGEQCNLHIVKMKGWKRKMDYTQTGLQWVPSSPHIPHPHSAFFYPVSGILGELGYMSIGVGYTIPFQMFAAPWMEAEKLAGNLNRLNVPGVIFRPMYLKPFYSVGKGELLQGVQVHIMDFGKAPLSDLQFLVMQEVAALYPDRAVFDHADKGRFNMFDKVSGSRQIRERFSKRNRWEDIRDYWYKDAEDFRKLSKKYYLYK